MAIELLLLLKKELQPWNRQVKKVEVKRTEERLHNVVEKLSKKVNR